MAQNAKDKDLTYDAQRRRIEKLMENPEKIIEIPDSSLSLKKRYEPPAFVRNVMGSSAGAGSGEFHVYRHLRRKEMIRLKEMDEAAIEEELDREFKEKLDEAKRKAEEKSIKRKLKRDKKRRKIKANKKAAGESPAIPPNNDPDQNKSDNVIK